MVSALDPPYALCYTVPDSAMIWERPNNSPRLFNTTHWTCVLTAGDETSNECDSALETLCRNYWPPLYHFARRKGNSPQDAEDLVQGFFANLLEKAYLKDADRERGKFRTFLLSSFSHFMANEWDRKRRAKRGGDAQIFSIHASEAEGWLELLPVDRFTPERIFERAWAQQVVGIVLRRLRHEFAANDEVDRFELLQGCLMGGQDEPYLELGERLGLSEGAVKTAVRRMRLRFRALLIEELRQTLQEPEMAEEEARYLLLVLSET